jgi:hypothetical protein
MLQDSGIIMSDGRINLDVALDKYWEEIKISLEALKETNNDIKRIVVPTCYKLGAIEGDRDGK